MTRAALRNRRDILAGLFLIGLATAFALIGTQYRFGTLFRMGPGFFPLMASGILAALGLAVIVTARRERSDADRSAPEQPDLRTAAAVLGGLLAFALALQRVGLVVATFLLVGIAALGESRPRLLRSAIIAAVLATVGVVLFTMTLGIRIPIFRWPL